MAKKASVPYSVILFDYEVKRCFANAQLLTRLKAVLDTAENIFLVSEYTAGLIERLEIPEEKKYYTVTGGLPEKKGHLGILAETFNLRKSTISALNSVFVLTRK